jgi:hypothetical protein
VPLDEAADHCLWGNLARNQSRQKTGEAFGFANKNLDPLKPWIMTDNRAKNCCGIQMLKMPRPQ